MTAISGFLGFGEPEELTISDGEVTATKTPIKVASETAPVGTADNLDTINGGEEGDICIVMPASGHAITVRDSQGNIKCGSNKVLNNTRDNLMLRRGSNNWTRISFADN